MIKIQDSHYHTVLSTQPFNPQWFWLGQVPAFTPTLMRLRKGPMIPTMFDSGNQNLHHPTSTSTDSRVLPLPSRHPRNRIQVLNKSQPQDVRRNKDAQWAVVVTVGGLSPGIGESKNPGGLRYQGVVEELREHIKNQKSESESIRPEWDIYFLSIWFTWEQKIWHPGRPHPLSFSSWRGRPWYARHVSQINLHHVTQPTLQKL